MKKLNKALMLLALAVTGVATTGCDDYLDVNKNQDAPDYVDAYLYLAGIEQEYYGIYYDLRAAAPLTQMFGTSSYTNFANHYYTAGSDAGGELWRMVYWNQGMNLENLINQSLEAENWTLAGIGYAIKAFSWDMMTKYHGELPMKQAFVSGLLSHEYDYQYDIYPQVREWAYTAIELLQRDDATNYGTKISANDYIYGGDKEKWIKFAYAVIVRNLASLTNKNDFQSQYYNELVSCAEKAFSSNADNAELSIAGGSSSAAYSAYNNFWGVYRGNLGSVYWPHEYAVQIMTGRVPKYNEADGNWMQVDDYETKNLRYEIADQQIICDTLEETGHFDPRPLVKLATKSYIKRYMNITTGKDADGNEKLDTTYYYEPIEKEDNVNNYKKYVFNGGTFTGTSSSFLNNSELDPEGGTDATVPTIYNTSRTWSGVRLDENTCGTGRWLYDDNAPYILTTYAEVMFDLAEAHYKVGNKAAALQAWKKAVAADLEFTASHIIAGKVVTASGKKYHTGDILDKAQFNTLAQEYINGPYVNGMTEANFTLSHIMMQKFDALFPWGALEAWVDQRKYMYDIEYSGDYPYNGNGWTLETIDQKKDSDPTKVYKGFYLAPAQVQGRKGSYNVNNNGSPCFRIRPRYNSEYMWNKPNLEVLKPIPGTADDYQCSIPWFAYPGDMPTERK